MNLNVSVRKNKVFFKKSRANRATVLKEITDAYLNADYGYHFEVDVEDRGSYFIGLYFNHPFKNKAESTKVIPCPLGRN